MNSFFLFCDANRSKVQKSNPDKSNADITSLLGHYWRTMAANEKKKYKDLASAKRKVNLKKYCATQKCVLNVIFLGVCKIKSYSKTKEERN